MSEIPKISVCIPTYNRKTYLLETLKSVCNQTVKDFVIVIVDDGSTDGTAQMVKGLNLRNLIYHYQKNSGDAAARNKLIELATGQYLTFIDSDDLLVFDALERMVGVIQSQDEDVIAYGPYLRIDKDGNIYGRCNRRLYSGYITQQLFQNIFVHSCGSMFPRRIFDNPEIRFDTTLKVCSDYKLWLTLSTKYRFIGLQEPTFKRRRHNDNLSSVSSYNLLCELSVLEEFYQNHGKEIIPKNEARKRLSKEQYRVAKAFRAEGDHQSANFYFALSFKTKPNLKSFFKRILYAD